jgi:hypothetical protein
MLQFANCYWSDKWKPFSVPTAPLRQSEVTAAPEIACDIAKR